MSIIRNSILYAMSMGVSKGLPFILLPLLTRYLSVEEFGVLGVATAVVSILAIIIGFNPSFFIVTKFYKLNKIKLGLYIYNVLLISLLCCIVIVLFVISFPDILIGYKISQTMLIVIVLVSLSRVIVSLGLSVLQMQKKALYYFWVNIVFFILMLISVYFFIVLFMGNWEGVFVSELIIGGSITVLIIHFLKKDGYITTKLQLDVLKNYMRFSLPLVPHVLAFWVMNLIDRIFLAEMTDMKTVGLYSTAYMLGIGVSLLHESIHKAWQPYFFEYLSLNKMSLKQRMVRYTWLYYLGSIVIFFLYVEVLRLCLPLLVDNKYQSSMAFIPLIALGYTVLGMYRVIAGYLYYYNRTGILAVVTISSALLNIVMNFMLIPINGAIGAAQATLIAFVFLFVVTKLIVVRSCDMPWIGVSR